MLQRTRNYSDRSNDSGFQFEFFCDKCGNGHMSPFVTSKLGFASSLLEAAGPLFGGAASSAASAGGHLKDALRGKAWDSAYGEAVQAGKAHFEHCTRCGQSVCPESRTGVDVPSQPRRARETGSVWPRRSQLPAGLAPLRLAHRLCPASGDRAHGMQGLGVAGWGVAVGLRR